MIFPDGNYAISIINDKKLFPIWSAKVFAELTKNDGWENCQILKLTLDDFEETLFYYIDENNQDIHDLDGQSENVKYEYAGKVIDINDELTIIEIKNKIITPIISVEVGVRKSLLLTRY